jgi:hypothetical protein
MPEPESERPAFSPAKALLHVIIVLFLLVALGRVFARIDAFPNPERVGDAGVVELLWAFALALVASFGLQTGRRFLLFGGLAGILVLVGLQVHAFLTLALDKKFTPEPLTAEEKRRPEMLIIDDKARLCHDALGFSLPHPSGFEPQTALEDELNAQFSKENPNIGQWAYADPETGEAVLILVAKGVGQTEESFRGFAKGMRSSWDQNPEIEIRDEDFSWSGGQGEYNVSTSIKDARMALRCLSRTGADEAGSLVVCAETVAQEGDPLSGTRKGLRLTSCGA